MYHNSALHMTIEGCFPKSNMARRKMAAHEIRMHRHFVAAMTSKRRIQKYLLGQFVFGLQQGIKMYEGEDAIS